jgi:hypothetical protein
MDPRVLENLQDGPLVRLSDERPEEVPIRRLPRPAVLAKLDREQSLGVDPAYLEVPEIFVGGGLDLGVHIPCLDLYGDRSTAEESVLRRTRDACLVDEDLRLPDVREEPRLQPHEGAGDPQRRHRSSYGIGVAHECLEPRAHGGRRLPVHVHLDTGPPFTRLYRDVHPINRARRLLGPYSECRSRQLLRMERKLAREPKGRLLIRQAPGDFGELVNPVRQLCIGPSGSLAATSRHQVQQDSRFFLRA